MGGRVPARSLQGYVGLWGEAWKKTAGERHCWSLGCWGCWCAFLVHWAGVFAPISLEERLPAANQCPLEASPPDGHTSLMVSNQREHDSCVPLARSRSLCMPLIYRWNARGGKQQWWEVLPNTWEGLGKRTGREVASSLDSESQTFKGNFLIYKYIKILNKIILHPQVTLLTLTWDWNIIQCSSCWGMATSTPQLKKQKQERAQAERHLNPKLQIGNILDHLLKSMKKKECSVLLKIMFEMKLGTWNSWGFGKNRGLAQSGTAKWNKTGISI